MYSADNASQAIKERILSGLTSNIDRTEGSFVYDAVSPTAIELAKAHLRLDQVLKLVFADTALEVDGGSAFLEKRANEFGVYRKDGTKASATVDFEGSVGSDIPKGTIVQTPSGLRYFTIESVTIAAGTVSVPIEAEKIGRKYNVPAEVITQLPVQVVGVNSVSNPEAVTNGTDMESYQELLARFLNEKRLPATSGNIYHYKKWAQEVDGVGDVRVFPLWGGAGTVKVVIINANREPADQLLESKVYQHIEENRPIGADVTVVSASGVPLNINVTLKLAGNYTLPEVTAAIEAKIINYLRKEIAFKQNTVSYAYIGSLIIGTAGVLDYTTFTLNGGNANIPLADDQVAYLNTPINSTV